MEISVIIPSYKPQDYIWECLDSLRDQTFNKEKFEIILILNGCNEPYHTQIKYYIDNNLVGYNVNFIQTDTGGVSNARNIGLDVARGKYITFIDDDDYVSPQYLEELYQNASPNIVSIADVYVFDDISKYKLFRKMNPIFEQFQNTTNKLNIHFHCFFGAPYQKLFPKHHILGRRFNKKFKNGEDSLFLFLISDKISEIKFTSKNAIYYRRHRMGSAVTIQKKRLEIFKNCICLIFEYSKIYFSNPLKYSLLFYISRILATCKHFIK